LRADGMLKDASRYAYRARLLKRRALLYERHILRYLGSWILAGLTGYGYRLGRTRAIYLTILSVFAALYLTFGASDGHAFTIAQAAVFSMTSFHGSGFFPGSLKVVGLVTILAIVEALVGLLIETSFLVTLIQRFLGK